jgi:glycosyltransferase involved in cell wall biosynthesis
MKVLYINNYKDGTGWANAGINNMLALDAAGVEVVPRAITFNSAKGECPDRITELEDNSTSDCDICIQHTLPHLYSYDGNFRNIGFFATESSNFKDTFWHKSCNLMDELWVPSLHTRAAARLSGVTKPIHVAPHSLNMESYQDTGGNKINELIGTFNFAFIGEFVERKNLQALIKAFHSEFSLLEPVNLYIKTSLADLDAVQQFCKEVKDGLKLRSRYKEEVVIAGMLQRLDYNSVLSQCHSFVMPSRGEAFCIPALEAMALGVPVIYTQNTGMEDFCSGTSVSSYSTPCFGALSTLPDLDTANSTWSEIDVVELGSAMRTAFMKWNTEMAAEESEAAKEKALDYDHKIIGQKLKELLNDG